MKKIILMLILFLTLLNLAGCSENDSVVYELEENESSISSGSESIDGKENETLKESTLLTDEKICVYICGEVRSPGVYELEAGSRVYQVIELAGGLLSTADERNINQAQQLFDGQQIIVYSKEEQEAVQAGQEEPESGGKININTAGKEELMKLTGIGEARAEDIIKYRDENGFFTVIDDIKNVTGIKDKMFEKIKDEITV